MEQNAPVSNMIIELPKEEPITQIGFRQQELIDRDDLNHDEAWRLYKIVDEVRKRIAKIKSEIYEIGRTLTEAKSILGHGKFIEYFRTNFEFSYATANNFMNVYKHCIGEEQGVASSFFTSCQE